MRSVNLILSVTNDGYIGVTGGLCVHSKRDLAFFKETTHGSVCIMGRKTFESLPSPLVGRTMFIITSTPSNDNEFSTLEDAILAAPLDKEIFVIGGAAIFDLAFKYAKTIFISKFDTTCPTGRNMIKVPDVLLSLSEMGYKETIIEGFFELSGVDKDGIDVFSTVIYRYDRKYVETKSIVLDEVELAEISQTRGGKFICDTCLRSDTGWINRPVALFYCGTVPPEDSVTHHEWLAVCRIGDGLRYFNGISAVEPGHTFVGIETKCGVLYSSHRHNFVKCDKDGSFIDGGRDYTRFGIGEGVREVWLTITPEGLMRTYPTNNA
jgi:dihydrofolate reductase